ncbi:MAG TPA: maleylpyruvate isomerase family mycothiol-dependent enzyme [Micromonosporaceae bacterium]
MSADPLDLMPEVDHATERLLGTVDGLTDADMRRPSLCRGWTRGHVLTHLARNADGLTNLLTWARTGVVTPQYESWDRRNADIEDGAGRDAAALADDLRAAARRFAVAVETMPPEAWSVELPLHSGPQRAARIVWRRLREVEVHHVDLDAGYGPTEWPDAFSHRLLHEVVAQFSGRGTVPAVRLRADGVRHELSIGSTAAAPLVSGPASAVAAWLTGRSPGAELTVEPEGPLPAVPDWI